MDIMIARINFPNDPTHTITAHQMFVAEESDEHICLYSISSLFGKERRVYGEDKENYVVIASPEYQKIGLKVPSFIDCAKMYEIAIGKNTELSRLSQRQIDPIVAQMIHDRIAEIKSRGRHKIYKISEDDFLLWNPRASRNRT